MECIVVADVGRPGESGAAVGDFGTQGDHVCSLVPRDPGDSSRSLAFRFFEIGFARAHLFQQVHGVGNPEREFRQSVPDALLDAAAPIAVGHIGTVLPVQDVVSPGDSPRIAHERAAGFRHLDRGVELAHGHGGPAPSRGPYKTRPVGVLFLPAAVAAADPEQQRRTGQESQAQRNLEAGHNDPPNRAARAFRATRRAARGLPALHALLRSEP